MRQKSVQAKHLSELELLEAVERFHGEHRIQYPHFDILLRDRPGARPPDEALADRFPPKVIIAKMENLYDRGLLEVGVSIRTAWLTDKGKERLKELRRQNEERRLGE